MILREKLHRNIFIGSLFLLAISIRVSVFLMSLSQFILYGNWILEGQFKEKWNRIKTNKHAWFFISIYAIHLLWLFPPQDYAYALNDLRIKLPLLLMPFFVVSSKPIENKTLKNILLIFTASVVFASFIILYRWYFQENLKINDYRQLSPFISHIRYSLMIVFSIFILFYYSFIKKEAKAYLRYIFTFAFIYLILFMFILRANTGIFIFIILCFFIAIQFLFKSKSYLRWIIWIIIVSSIFVLFQYTNNIWKSFIRGMKEKPPKTFIYTPNGNLYMFYDYSKEVENGNRVWFYVEEKELQSSWNNISKVPYNGKDTKGNEIRFTLVRYLASKNLTKDSFGCSKLNSNDIQSIQNGIPNYRYTEKWSLYPYIYSFLWDYYSHRYLGYVNGSSFFQRVEYLRTASKIIKNNFWFGVGTGNVKNAFDNKYIELNSPLEPIFRLRAHNQLITFLLTFGIFGFFWILFALIYPYLKNINGDKFLQLIFFGILIISFFNEDTLETQAGLTFVVFFYILLSIGKEKKLLTGKTP